MPISLIGVGYVGLVRGACPGKYGGITFGRNRYNPITLARQGFTYICVGRGRVNV